VGERVIYIVDFGARPDLVRLLEERLDKLKLDFLVKCQDAQEDAMKGYVERHLNSWWNRFWANKPRAFFEEQFHMYAEMPYWSGQVGIIDCHLIDCYLSAKSRRDARFKRIDELRTAMREKVTVHFDEDEWALYFPSNPAV